MHSIPADKNVLVQINHWPKYPEFQGLWVSGTVLPAVEAAGLIKEVKMESVTGFTPDIGLIAPAAGILVGVAEGVLLVRRRGRRDKPLA